jgi:hypothetical protein
VTVHSINRRASAHAAPLARAIPLCQKGSRQRAAGTELGRSRKVLRAVAILKLVAVRLKVGVAVRDVRDLDGEIDQSLSQSFEFTASCRVRKHRRRERLDWRDQPRMFRTTGPGRAHNQK